jgi:uncharacterized membrane protein required for colicin V production
MIHERPGPEGSTPIERCNTMNPADFVIIGLVGVLGLIGMKSGLLKPASGIGGLVLGIIFAIQYGGEFAPLFAQYVEGERQQSIAAFIAVLVAVAITTRIVASLIKKLLSALVLGWVDHVAGAVAGAILGIILVGTGVNLLVRADFGPTHDALAASTVGPEISRASLISAFASGCGSLKDAVDGAEGCPDVKGLVGKFAGAELTASVNGIFDQDIGNLAKVVKGTLGGGSPEEIASLVGFDGAEPEFPDSVDGIFDQDVGDVAKVLNGTFSGGSPMDIAESLAGFDEELPNPQATEE